MKDDDLKRVGDAIRAHVKERQIEFRLIKPRTNPAGTPREVVWSSKMLLDEPPMHPQCRSVAQPPNLETPTAPFWRETWFWEQVVYVLLFLGPATVASYLSLAAKGSLSARDVVFLVGTALSQFVAQKARSAASRQAALAKRAKIVTPEIRCASKVKRWTQAGQVLGAFLSVATSPTWWHVPSVLWALFLYNAWRTHREAAKSRGVAKGCYGTPNSQEELVREQARLDAEARKSQRVIGGF